MQLDDARFPIRFSVTQSMMWHDSLFAELARALELPSGVVPRFSSVGAAVELERLKDGGTYDGFARVERVRGKTVDGVKVAMVEYTYFLRNQGKAVLVSCALDPSSIAALAKPPSVSFSTPTGPLELTAELRARVKALQR